MRKTLNQQLQSYKGQGEQQQRSNYIDFDSSRYNHLKQGHLLQPMRSTSNIEESQVNVAINHSMAVSGVLRKKGINMVSPNPCR
jgi:hypothetical protein